VSVRNPANRALKRQHGASPLETPTNRPGGRFYVTVRDGSRTGFLLGPYASHIMAQMHESRGRKLAQAAVSDAAFYTFGTASLPRSRKTVFGR
jgi:hypothetical protein